MRNVVKSAKVFEEKGANNGCVQGVGFIIDEEGNLKTFKGMK